MNICIFDTETTSLDKPFCYNVGYVIVDTDTREFLIKREFVVEQIWHNIPLFQSAYYANKRPIYVQAMRARAIIMDKWGYICQKMIRDFKAFNVEMAFAFNSSFDEKVFDFNCDWFKCANPFDTINIKDIRGFAHHFLVGKEYKDFCEKYNLFSETGNYSTTAENMYRFVSGNLDFIEDHTALSDSEIEASILFSCLDAGADLNKNYAAFRSIPRKTERELHIKTREGDDFYFKYENLRMNRERTEIKLK